MIVDRIFYVYEHWRPDTDCCFYVGKGHHNRAWEFRRRNQHHRHVMKQLARAGMCAEIRMVREALTESESLILEMERIAFWRGGGISLCNITNGGDGFRARHSEATKACLKAARKGQKIVHSAETKRKIGTANAVALKGKKNPEHSVRLKGRSLSAKHRAAIGRGLVGRRVSEETRKKLKDSHTGKTRSETTRARLRASHLGNRPTEITLQRRAESMRKIWADPQSRRKMLEARERC